MAKMTKENMPEYIKSLNDFAEDENNLMIRAWATGHGGSFKWTKESCEGFPDFSEAYRRAKTIIGVRRERKVLEGKLPHQLVQRTMRLYDKELFENDVDFSRACHVADERQTVNVTIKKYSKDE